MTVPKLVLTSKELTLARAAWTAGRNGAVVASQVAEELSFVAAAVAEYALARAYDHDDEAEPRPLGRHPDGGREGWDGYRVENDEADVEGLAAWWKTLASKGAVRKNTGPMWVPGHTRSGRRLDADCLAVGWMVVDADDVGTSDALENALSLHGAAFARGNSPNHCPGGCRDHGKGVTKWRLALPLRAAWVPFHAGMEPTDEGFQRALTRSRRWWKQGLYAAARWVLSVVGELAREGADPSTSDLLNRFYPCTPTTGHGKVARDIVARTGLGFDLEACHRALVDLGVAEPLEKVQAEHEARAASGGSWKPADGEHPMVSAFKAAGLYIGHLGDGKHAVTCPWEDTHSPGDWPESDTVLMDGETLSCKHRHPEGKGAGAEKAVAAALGPEGERAWRVAWAKVKAAQRARGEGGARRQAKGETVDDDRGEREEVEHQNERPEQSETTETPPRSRPSKPSPLDGLEERAAQDVQVAFAEDVLQAAAKLDPGAFAALKLRLKKPLAGNLQAWTRRVRSVAAEEQREANRRATEAVRAGGGLVLERGDAPELAGVLLRGLRGDSSEPVVWDAYRFWRYEKATGVWEALDHDLPYRVVADLAGTEVEGEKGNRPLKLSSGDIDGALKAAAKYASRPAFFALEPHGLAPVGVVCESGFVTVREGRVAVEPYAPDHRALHALPFPYDPTASAPTWDRMLLEYFTPQEDPGGDLEDAEARTQACEDAITDARACVDLLHELMGASLLGLAPSYERCAILYGTGANGKSQVLFVWRALFPAAAVCSVPPQQWSNVFHLAQLAGKLCNLVSELPERDILDSTVFKAVVTGDATQASHKHKDPFTLSCRAAHIFAANKLPGTADQTEGFWRRFVVLPFLRKFEREGAVVDIYQQVVANELPGVFARAVQGAERLLRQGGYTEARLSQEQKEEWQEDADQVRQFVSECCSPSGESNLRKDLYPAYVQWAAEAGHSRLARDKLGARLKLLGYARRSMLARFYALTLKPDAVPKADGDREGSRSRYGRGYGPGIGQA